ncbi:hypothetical protein GPALN_007477 [Globodera pallida]|nr:hypothetical protein GPALN_007477 [Globodera pallida]
MAPSATSTPETIGNDEMAMNIKLCSAVQEMHEQLATQMDMCNNLLAQFASIRRISMTAYGGATPLMDRLTTRRFHPSWGNRLKSRLHSSISETVENLRQFSVGRLPDLARQCDRAQSSAKDDVTLLVADFEFSLSVDAARPNSAIFDRYTFETDDRALVAAHLRRLAARLDAELDRLTNSIGFETDDSGGGAMSTLAPNRSKFRRHAFALKGSTKGTTTTTTATAT